jgi:hypothetical protein
MGRGWKRIEPDSDTAPVPYPTAVFQGVETVASGEDLRRHLGQCAEDATLGGVDCHVADQVSATQSYLWLVAVESGGPLAAAVVRLPRFVGLDRSPLPSATAHRVRA